MKRELSVGNYTIVMDWRILKKRRLKVDQKMKKMFKMSLISSSTIL